jgi:hypothetical protein
MTNTDTVERLRELRAKATEGPWYADQPDSFGDVNLRTRHEELAIGAIVNGAFKAMGQRSDTPEANAALIVEAINALPALLDAVEALEPFATAEMRGQSAHVTDGPRLDGRKVIHLIIEGDGFDAYNRARTALATLKGEG